MRSQTLRTATVILLGFILAIQGSVAASFGVIAPVAKAGCCHTDCNSKNCSTPACCAKPAENPVPFSPASLPSSSQNEFHALAASAVSLLALLPFCSTVEAPSRAISSASVTAIPLFQRDCCYLL